jgi:hypothetical protein
VKGCGINVLTREIKVRQNGPETHETAPILTADKWFREDVFIDRSIHLTVGEVCDEGRL